MPFPTEAIHLLSLISHYSPVDLRWSFHFSPPGIRPSSRNPSSRGASLLIVTALVL